MIPNYLGKLNSRVIKTPFIFILIIIQVYFLINGKAHFPNWDESYGQLMIIYLLMTVVFLVWSGRETRRELNKPIGESIGIFVGFFFATYILLFITATFSGTEITPIPPELFWPTVIIQVCVVAVAEEIMFRGVFLEHFGIIVSSVLFAVWHSYAYGVLYYIPEGIGLGTITSLVIAFVMGIVFAIVSRKWGLSGSIAIHACYNLFVSGAFITFSIM